MLLWVEFEHPNLLNCAPVIINLLLGYILGSVPPACMYLGDIGPISVMPSVHVLIFL